jgi:hypothetical protein
MTPEQIIQCQLMDWIRAQKDLAPYVFHIANERQTSPKHGRILKRMGVRPGVSDLFVGIPSQKYHGLFLELKADSGKPTPAQLEFIETMARQGYAGAVVYGFAAAKQKIQEYLQQTPFS